MDEVRRSDQAFGAPERIVEIRSMSLELRRKPAVYNRKTARLHQEIFHRVKRRRTRGLGQHLSRLLLVRPTTCTVKKEIKQPTQMFRLFTLNDTVYKLCGFRPLSLITKSPQSFLTLFCFTHPSVYYLSVPERKEKESSFYQFIHDCV